MFSLNVKSNDLKYLLAGYFILLLMHLLLYRFVAIYPSLIFPSFSDAPKMNGMATFSTFELFALSSSNEIVKINEDEFFEDLYSRHSTFIMGSIVMKQEKKSRFIPLQKDLNKFKLFARTKLRKLYPNTHFKALVISKQEKVYSFKTRKVTTLPRMEKQTLIALK